MRSVLLLLLRPTSGALSFEVAASSSIVILGSVLTGLRLRGLSSPCFISLISAGPSIMLSPGMEDTFDSGGSSDSSLWLPMISTSIGERSDTLDPSPG